MYDLDALSSKIDAHSAKWIKRILHFQDASLSDTFVNRVKSAVYSRDCLYILNGKGNREGAYGN